MALHPDVLRRVMGISQSASNRQQQPGSFLPGHGLAQALLERAAGQVLNYQVGHTVVIPVINHADDIGMGKLGQ